jgi:hypothetical protein
MQIFGLCILLLLAYLLVLCWNLESKSRSTLLGACTACPVLRSDLEAAAVEIKDLKHKLDLSSRYTILSPPCEACVSLKGKFFHATKENTELQQ